MEYGCIGEHLPHSFSREIHEKIAPYRYELREIPGEELDGFMRKHDFKAINVTIPYKKAVIPYLSHLSKEASEIGAVNTVVSRDGVLFGYNTDFAGMTALIRKMRISMNGKKVLVLGTGGTSCTAAACAEALGAASVTKVSRTKKPGAVTYEEACTHYRESDVLINTTPAGMYPDTESCPIDLSYFTNLSAVIDAVYNPLRTELVSRALEAGIPAEGGLYMLTAQAVYAYEIFSGNPADDGLIERIYREILSEKENIVLTGMPGSGKSTIGKILGERLGRPVLDTDDAVVREKGCPIRDIFENEGEKAFRDLESSMIKEISKRSGIVITTGGGSVLREENVRMLKRNGRLFFLDRDPDELLPSFERPLSDNEEKLRALFSERMPVYLASADTVVPVLKTPEETAEALLKELL